MKRNGTIVRYTAEEIDAMIAEGKTETDWARVRATTEEEIVRQIIEDPDEELDEWVGMIPINGLPFPLPDGNKQQVTIRLDPQVVAHFKQAGRGWQSRINAVLRSYVESREKA